MMRSLLFLTVLLTVSGCTFGLRGGDVYQARGVTLALEMRGAGVIAGQYRAPSCCKRDSETFPNHAKFR